MIRDIYKNKLIFTLVVIDLVLIGLFIWFFYPPFTYILTKEQYSLLIDIFGIIIIPYNSIIALLLPIIIKQLEKEYKEEENKKIREKCYNALEEICNLFFQKENNSRNAKLLVLLEILKVYNEERLNLNIYHNNIRYFNQNTIHDKLYAYELEISMKTDSAKLIEILIKLNGAPVENRSDLNTVLEKIKANINDGEKN